MPGYSTTSRPAWIGYPRQPSLLEETHVKPILRRQESTDLRTPTCPDGRLQRSESSDPTWFSARMFVTQLLSMNLPTHWNCSGTEPSFCSWTPCRLRVSPGSEISLSEVIKPPGKASESCFMSSRAVQGVVRRATKRKRSILVLLPIPGDLIPVTATFSITGDCVLRTPTNANDLPDFLLDELRAFLLRHVSGCSDNPPSLNGSDGSAKS